MKQFLDRLTGVTPMYKMVIMGLLAIVAVAIVLSLAGLLFYKAEWLAASAAVSVLTAVGTSWIFGRIMHTSFHPESSIITGLLVFMIMQPTAELLPNLGVALAALIASASKYLLAIRGRHLLNPAAVGAFAVGLTGLNFPTWWVGTPYLQPIIILGALLVLYRTQRLVIGGTFVFVASAIGVTGTLIAGVPLQSALEFAFLSSPLLFFAGFLLSEPLSLPPRRWQQLVVVVSVALLYSIPFSIGPIYSSPLLALLLGNLIAFAFGQRRGIRLRFLHKTQLGLDTWEVTFQPTSPLRFLPGQYMEITVPHHADFRGTRRYLSISSAPGEGAEKGGPITFAISLPPNSSTFKSALLNLEPGTIIHGTGVSGDFALPRNLNAPLLLVAGGIGITPFASQLAWGNRRGEKRDLVVAYSVSNAEQLPYMDLLEKSGAHVVLFGPSPTTLPEGWKYGGAGPITGAKLTATVPDLARRRAFVSGPPTLVNHLRKALRSQGSKHIRTDYFSGY